MDELDAIAQTEIQQGWEVLDADDQPIGRVSAVHTASFSVETSIGGTREIPFTDVESADGGIVTISVSGDELTSDIGA
jgi:hypothetical protein